MIGNAIAGAIVAVFVFIGLTWWDRTQWLAYGRLSLKFKLGFSVGIGFVFCVFLYLWPLAQAGQLF